MAPPMLPKVAPLMLLLFVVSVTSQSCNPQIPKYDKIIKALSQLPQKTLGGGHAAAVGGDAIGPGAVGGAGVGIAGPYFLG